MRDKSLRLLFVSLYLLFSSTSIASAQGVLDGEDCRVPPEMTITGDLFVLCGQLTIEGVVEGSVIGGARDARITGEVQGSLYLFGAELEVAGDLGKDVHYAGLVLEITPQARFQHARGSVIALSLSHTVDSGGTVPGNITNVGYQLVVDGDVGGEINFWGAALNIDGQVAQDVTATVGDSQTDGSSSQIETLLIPFPIEVELVDPGLVLGEAGRIDGQLTYRAPNPARLDGATALPPVHRGDLSVQEEGTPVERSARSVGRYLQDVFREFIGLAVIGLLAVTLVPTAVQSPMRAVRAHPLSSLGVGMLSFIMSFPIVLIFALLSVLIVLLLALLPLDNLVLFTGIVLGLANIGGASIFYFTAIYIARLVVGLAIGRVIFRLLLQERDDGSWRYLVGSMLLGLWLLAMLGTIPVVGWGFNALALFVGLGGILSVLRAQLARLGSTDPGPPPTLPAVTREAVTVLRLPAQMDDIEGDLPDDEPPDEPPGELHGPWPLPPDPDDGLPSTGMDNLPAGFNWWRSERD